MDALAHELLAQIRVTKADNVLAENDWIGQEEAVVVLDTLQVGDHQVAARSLVCEVGKTQEYLIQSIGIPLSGVVAILDKDRTAFREGRLGTEATFTLRFVGIGLLLDDAHL